MDAHRPVVLSIAGLDPSGGAGLLADVKTFEENKVYGLGICTAQTIQTEEKFISIRWESEKDILEALVAMLSKYEVQAVKIGIVENMERLNNIASLIHDKNPAIKIIWDTVLRSSSGFDFLSGEMNKEILNAVLMKVFLITPNYNEAVKLILATDAKDAAKKLSVYCNILLKGGHNEGEIGVDYLYTKNDVQTLQPNISTTTGKHGSGCVMSSAITANLALGNGLYTSCVNAKRYIEGFLLSNESLLGYHHV